MGNANLTKSHKVPMRGRLLTVFLKGFRSLFRVSSGSFCFGFCLGCSCDFLSLPAAAHLFLSFPLYHTNRPQHSLNIDCFCSPLGLFFLYCDFEVYKLYSTKTLKISTWIINMIRLTSKIFLKIISVKKVKNITTTKNKLINCSRNYITKLTKKSR